MKRFLRLKFSGVGCSITLEIEKYTKIHSDLNKGIFILIRQRMENIV